MFAVKSKLKSNRVQSVQTFNKSLHNKSETNVSSFNTTKSNVIQNIIYHILVVSIDIYNKILL